MEQSSNQKPGIFGSLQEAYDRLEAIIENSYDGIYITDGKAVTLRINRAYETISGMTGHQVLGRSMWDMEREGLVSRSGTLLALAQRKPVTLEQTFRTGRHALIASTPIFDHQGEIAMVVTNVRDMTELYELQEKYRRSEETSRRYYQELELGRKQVLAEADLIAADPCTLEALSVAQRVAALDTIVLLLGETGVGKEKFAKYIYKHSARKTGRFLTVNCGAIPAALMESELFGYERGAFTGASREGKLGLFEVADKGTVFLDEVGELPLEMQVKLLRVLQEGQITRVGSSEPISVDVRILAATNRNLEQMVRDKTFREDLFYRLNVIPLTIPPLRKRRSDILPFVESFLAQLNQKYSLSKRFTPSALQCMTEYDWPGNVRELKNVVERMVIMSREEEICPADLPFRQNWLPSLTLPEASEWVNLKALTAEFEYRYLCKAYETHGNVRDAAASLGMDASTFVRKRQKYAERHLM